MRVPKTERAIQARTARPDYGATDAPQQCGAQDDQANVQLRPAEVTDAG